MNTAINYAHLFYSESANDAITLEKNVKENPVSAFARFLLLYHYKKNNDPEFEKFSKQSSLYFNDLYWLQLQLSQADLKYPDSTNHAPSLAHEENYPEAVFPGENNNLEKENEDEIISSGPKDDNIDSNEFGETINGDIPEEENTFTESQNENIYSKEQVESFNSDLPDENEFINSASKEDIKLEQPETINNDLPDEEKSKSQNENIYLEKHVESVNNDLPNEEKFIQSASNEDDIDLKEPAETFAFEPKEEMLEADLQKNEAPFENIKEEPLAFEPKEEILENVQVAAPFESETNNNNVSLSGNSDEEPLAFEPLYTVDYFASQGIKIKEEALMNDRLGKQMRSFTDWLKSMKKLHPGKLPEQNEVIEKIIQSSAEESNADAEVLTEAMAEVLIKQNKQEKAIEMYQKLSLLNPSKNTYFAAKIESLKTN